MTDGSEDIKISHGNQSTIVTHVHQTLFNSITLKDKNTLSLKTPFEMKIILLLLLISNEWQVLILSPINKQRFHPDN